MNNENFEKIIQVYMNNFNLINNDENCEYRKWEYFKEFQDSFDIEADDFGAMFKKAVKGASFLVDNAFVCPTNGIIYFADKQETRERVRNMFKALYADDNGDIKIRQSKIEKFRDDFNAMLEEYEPGKWKYKQDFRSVLLYLTLFNPDNNYLFKSTQVNAFKDCIEYGQSFGSGANFNLNVYYNMCDAIAEKIRNKPELVELHRNRITEDMYQDDNLTLLVFDIIFVAVAYDFYVGIEIKKPAKMSKAEREAYAKSQTLTAELEETQSELNQTMSLLEDLQSISISGMNIVHKQYGTGTVIEQNGTFVTIEFENKTVKFQFPAAFSIGYLIIEDETVIDYFRTRFELETRIKKLNDRIKVINSRLSK